MLKRKPKKLNLRQIHQLYLLLKHALPKKDEELLIDQLDVMVDRISGDDVIMQALEIMYGKKIEGNPLKLLLYFISGIKENAFFDYVHFLNRIKHD